MKPLTGKSRHDVSPGIVQLAYQGPAAVLSADDQPFAITDGTPYKTRLKTVQSHISVDPADNKAPYQLELSDKQASEPVDEREVPQPPDPSNLLAMLRLQVRQSFGATRELFEEVISPYETDVDLFEEDIAAAAKAQEDAAKADAEAAQGETSVLEAKSEAKGRDLADSKSQAKVDPEPKKSDPPKT